MDKLYSQSVTYSALNTDKTTRRQTMKEWIMDAFRAVRNPMVYDW